MTTKVKHCVHRFTRVIEDGGDYCPTCGSTRNIDGTVRPSIKPMETEIGGIKLRAEFRRNDLGTRLLTISAPEVRGQWKGQTLPAEIWQPGILATLSLKDGLWDARFGEWWGSYGDDSLLVRDATLAARYLNLKGVERMDLTSPLTGDLERAADAMGLRLPRLAARPGHAQSYGQFSTLAEYIAALARPKAPGPVNLRAGYHSPDGLGMPDGRMLAT